MFSSLDIRLIKFFFTHPEFSVNIISQYYPFTNEDLRRYSDKLDWFWVSMNEAIIWSEKLYNEFSNIISLPSLATNKNFPWTERFIDDNYIDLFYYLDDNGISKTMLSDNTSLPWSWELIEKYKEYWNWSGLSSNEGIPFTVELIEEFKGFWDEKMFAYNQRIISDPVIRFHLGISAINNIHICEYCNRDMRYIIEQKKIVNRYLLSCQNFKWDFSVLKFIKDTIDKNIVSKDILNFLSNNKSIPCNLNVLEMFQSEWNYFSLQMNSAVGRYLVEGIKRSSFIETMMEKLPKFDLTNIKYSIQDISDDETFENDKGKVNN